MQLDPQLYKFYGNRIECPLGLGCSSIQNIDSKYGEYPKKFIDAWREGRLKTGEITINETRIIVPFKKEVDLSNPSDWIAMDVNDSNFTTTSSNPHILNIETNLREIRSLLREEKEDSEARQA